MKGLRFCRTMLVSGFFFFGFVWATVEQEASQDIATNRPFIIEDPGFVETPAAAETTFENYFEHVNVAARWLKRRINGAVPIIMIVLTGGVSGPETFLFNKQEINIEDIPYFPQAKVAGHEGKLIFGELDGVDVVLLKGRFHYYEGHSAQKVVFPYFVMHELGVQALITVNAVGGIRHDLNPGDIMLVTDHINALGDNPLRGLAVQFPHNQFVDLNHAYDHNYCAMAKEVAKKENIKIKEGTYLATMGPSIETPAEVKMFRQWGADTVGMSTVFEVIACRYLGIKVLAFCGIANVSVDRHLGDLTHGEVLEVMSKMAPKLSSLMTGCARKIIIDYLKMLI